MIEFLELLEDFDRHVGGLLRNIIIEAEVRFDFVELLVWLSVGCNFVKDNIVIVIQIEYGFELGVHQNIIHDAGLQSIKVLPFC